MKGDLGPDALRTKELRQLFKEEVLPQLKAMGFRKQYPPLAAGDSKDLWGNNWSRRRGEFMDEIHIEWRTLRRPMFMIEFWTDQTERMTLYDPRLESSRGGDDFYGRIPVAGGRGQREVWYGENMTFDETLMFTTKHLASLDQYLRTGVTDAYLDLGRRPVVWRERPAELFPNPPPPPPRHVGRIERWFDALCDALDRAQAAKAERQRLRQRQWRLRRRRYLDRIRRALRWGPPKPRRRS